MLWENIPANVSTFVWRSVPAVALLGVKDGVRNTGQRANNTTRQNALYVYKSEIY